MTENILRQSREAESALADALKSPRRKGSGHSTGGYTEGFGDNCSDESETSSLCSEKSFDYTRGRPSDLGIWLGSREKLASQSWSVAAQDITDIIANCASTHWADRKDGLIGLQ